MKTFEIDTRSNEKGIIVVEAADHHEAAKTAARKMFPSYSQMITVMRNTGANNGSGMFQAYIPQGDMKSSHGNLFHVSEQ